jgi:uncharacterized protein YbjT (DUF2867 family)
MKKILLTGANGYIGKRLLIRLVNQGYFVVCCVRDANRFSVPEEFLKQIEIIQTDFSNPIPLDIIPKDISAAYYLIHSMSASIKFDVLEAKCAEHFKQALEQTQAEQVIYLSGISNEDNLSKHLASRKHVEVILESKVYALTTLRAGIIIGSGSASFEIIRDLVEKLPIMIAPRWLKTRSQPIAIRDVLSFLTKSLFFEKAYNRNFDIGGPDKMTYKEMLLGFAEVRRLTRFIGIVPVMTPKLSSYWLYFVTSTSYKLASALVSSMKVEVVCRDNELAKLLDIQPIHYKKAIELAFLRIQQNQILSSWKDSLVSGRFKQNISNYIKVPVYGCFKDSRRIAIQDSDATLDRIWKIGGETGWYHANFLWKIRGLMDKFQGGVGLRRGRSHPTEISAGDAIDFWRVLFASKDEKRLLLYAEMKVPGDAWLEFKISDGYLIQTATFRPLGAYGRIYWYAVSILHEYVFRGMVRKISV